MYLAVSIYMIGIHKKHYLGLGMDMEEYGVITTERFSTSQLACRVRKG